MKGAGLYETGREALTERAAQAAVDAAEAFEGMFDPSAPEGAQLVDLVRKYPAHVYRATKTRAYRDAMAAAAAQRRGRR